MPRSEGAGNSSAGRMPAWRRVALAAAGGTALLALATAISLQPPPARLPDTDAAVVARARYLDRNGVALNETRVNAWNLHARLPLHEVPPLQHAARGSSARKRPSRWPRLIAIHQ